MAYRLRPDESIPRGLRRLARKEIGAASDELSQNNPPRDAAIHEARKHIKKARAIVDLIDADGGRGLNGSRKRLRAVNRTLSCVRDADAMLAILDKLKQRFRGLFSERSFADLRRGLQSRKRELKEAAGRDGAWKDVRQELEKLRRDAARWRPAHGRFGSLAAGIRLTHRSGRKAMSRAQTRRRAADFHEWRKEMKALWYELRLLEACGAPIRRDIDALHDAETWLGDDHNVVVLCADISKDTSICRAGTVDVERVRLAANRFQCQLRDRAIAKTRRIYSRKPGEYLRGIKRAWKSARQSTNR
jgi:CHAD domain-containing protein